MPKRKRAEEEKVDLDSTEILDKRFKIIAAEPDYEINRYGQIRNRKHDTLLTHYIGTNGYRSIHIRHKMYLVHRLVAIAFIPNDDDELDQVNHKNRDRADCRLENLEWVSASMNAQHASKAITKEMMSESAKYKKRPVKQIDPTTGKLIRSFSSVIEAANALDIYAQNISAVLAGRKKIAGSFKWEADDEKKLIKPNSTIEGEKWLPIIGWEDLYEVSDIGRVRGKVRNLVLTGAFVSGYKTVALCKYPEQKTELVHRLVASAFLGPPASKDMVVNHKDENRLNNVPSNLEWLSQQENVAHSRGTKVHQIDSKTMSVVNTFNSVNAAERAVHTCHRTINKAILEGSMAAGFMWKLAD